MHVSACKTKWRLAHIVRCLRSEIDVCLWAGFQWRCRQNVYVSLVSCRDLSEQVSQTLIPSLQITSSSLVIRFTLWFLAGFSIYMVSLCLTSVHSFYTLLNFFFCFVSEASSLLFICELWGRSRLHNVHWILFEQRESPKCCLFLFLFIFLFLFPLSFSYNAFKQTFSNILRFPKITGTCSLLESLFIYIYIHSTCCWYDTGFTKLVL